METSKGPQGNDLEYGKNVEDWIIRRLEPKSAMIGHGSVSETAKVLVFDEDLINLRMLKVQSSLHGNMRGYRWGGLAYSN